MPTAIRAIIAAGSLAARIFHYRGGMQDRHVLGLVITSPRRAIRSTRRHKCSRPNRTTISSGDAPNWRPESANKAANGNVTPGLDTGLDLPVREGRMGAIIVSTTEEST